MSFFPQRIYSDYSEFHGGVPLYCACHPPIRKDGNRPVVPWADLVFIMLLSNSVQNAMVGSDTTLAGGLVAAASLFVINAVFKECMYRIPWFGKFFAGRVADADLPWKGERRPICAGRG
jgi:hypothetical protein